MKAKDLIKYLETVNPEAEIVVHTGAFETAPLYLAFGNKPKDKEVVLAYNKEPKPDIIF